MRIGVNLPNMSALSILETGEVLAVDLRWAETPVARMKGLLGGPPLGPGQALVIETATQVHTFGLSYPIDVIFCDSDATVLHIVRAMPRRRVTRWVRRARYAIELPAGTVSRTLRPGARLSFDVSPGSRRAL